MLLMTGPPIKSKKDGALEKNLKKKAAEGDEVEQEEEVFADPPVEEMNPALFLGGGAGSGPAAEMSAADKRKLFGDIKTAMKPFITTLCEMSISKGTQLIKMQIKKQESDLIELGQKMSAKTDKDVKGAKVEARKLNTDLIARLEDEVRMIFKHMARNKVDTDL